MADTRIYKHPKRPEWGMAVVREWVEDRVRFVFEDAQVRAFKTDMLGALEIVDLAEPDAAALRAKLQRKAPAPRNSRTAAAARKVATPTFERQLASFALEFPDGFKDARYQREERGVGDPAGRDALITSVQAKLSRSTFESRMNAGKEKLLYEVARTLMQAGDVSRQGTFAAKAKPLRQADQPAYVRSLYELLYGTGSYGQRFDNWVGAMHMEPMPTWPAATYLQALVHPGTQIFVKRSFWRTQAGILEMDGTSASLPSGDAQARFLAVAQHLKDRLASAGLVPKDLWDVYSFTARTLGPKISSSAQAEV